MSIQEFRCPQFLIGPVKDTMIATVAERLRRTNEAWSDAVDELARRSVLSCWPSPSTVDLREAERSREGRERELEHRERTAPRAHRRLS